MANKFEGGGIENEPIKPRNMNTAVDFDDPENGLFKILEERVKTIDGESKKYNLESQINIINKIRELQQEGEGFDINAITRAGDVKGGANNLREVVSELLKKELKEVAESKDPELEGFKAQVEQGIKEAEDLIKERFENAPEEKNNLAFHNSEHTRGVIRRIDTILSAIQKADPDLVDDRDVALGRLVAAWHDTVQDWEPDKQAWNEGKQKWLPDPKEAGINKRTVRKRFTTVNENASYEELFSFIQKMNRDKSQEGFGVDDVSIAKESIMATVPGWDGDNKTVSQPNFEKAEKISLVAVALALADLGTAGMDGPEEAIKGSKALFREENLDMIDAIKNQEKNPIPGDKKGYFKNRMVDYLKKEVDFFIGRRDKFPEGLKTIPSKAARGLVEKLFDKFEDSIEGYKKAVVEAEKMSFEELAKYMGY